MPLPVALLLITMFVPRELEFQLGVALTPQRLVLLALLPVCLMRLLTSRNIKVRAFDVLLIGAFTYFWIALFSKETLDKALSSGSSIFLEAVGGYMVARIFIRSSEQFRATVRLLFWLAVITGAAAAIESITHTHWIKDWARSISGARPIIVNETRMGLMRASVTIDHPILYGTFCAAVFALVWFTERDVLVRMMRATLVAGALFFSLSSAPLLALLFVLVGSVWERTTRAIPNRVWMTIGIATVVYLVVAAAADRSPARILSTSIVFDADNAYYRLAIWEYGTANVANHPWVGVPLGTWERPSWMVSSTVDHYWLLTAMSGGLPALVLYSAAILVLLRSVNLRRHLPEPIERRQCRYAWTATVLALCFVGITVAYWREIEVFFTFCLGMGAWMADPPRTSQKVVKSSPRKK